MKVLIIGAGGFVGGYLLSYIKKELAWNVAVTKLENENIYFDDGLDKNSVNVYNLDILDISAIKKIILKEMPDYIFHLAAQSSVFLSWKNPSLTVDINIKGAINLLDAVRSFEQYNPRILLVGSSEEYGCISSMETSVSENTNTNPTNIYAITKLCQNFIGKVYSDAYSMNIIMVRAFNHFGPRQSSSFVVSDFCRQAAEIEKGVRENIIKTGNLSALRDFTDVRDIVRAYCMLIQKGKKGETYNVGSGKAVMIKDILDTIVNQVDVDINVEVDPNKIRPIDVKIIQADISKLVDETNWKPLFSLNDTIRDTLDYWRKFV